MPRDRAPQAPPPEKTPQDASSNSPTHTQSTAECGSLLPPSDCGSLLPPRQTESSPPPPRSSSSPPGSATKKSNSHARPHPPAAIHSPAGNGRSPPPHPPDPSARSQGSRAPRGYPH